MSREQTGPCDVCGDDTIDHFCITCDYIEIDRLKEENAKLKAEVEALKIERDHFKAGVDGARASLFGADY